MNKLSLLALCVTCCTASMYADYTSQDSTNTVQDSGWHDRQNDASLAKNIRDKLSSGLFSKGYGQVTVDVNNGAVVLRGSVKTWEDKNKIEKEVRNMDGVRSLNSQISVQEMKEENDKQKNEFPQDRYVTSADQQLNLKIRDKTSEGWIWDSYKTVALNTNNGVVTLEGTVDSKRDEQKLIEKVQKIAGVKSVVSNLSITK